MREATFFTFNGISSEDMGVQIISKSNGLFEESFLPNRSIVETKVSNREKPYFQRVVNEPLSFSMSFFIYEWQERDNLRQIARWLFQDYYKPLWFNNNPERVFYVIVEGDSSLFHNGGQEGYVTLNFRCDSPYTYSHPETISGIQSRISNPINHYSILNDGDMEVGIKLWITKKIGDGEIKITNTSNNKSLIVKNLQENEQLFIDCENEEIVSDLQYLGVYRYDDHNNIWISLIEGENILEFIGDFDLEIEYELKYLTD